MKYRYVATVISIGSTSCTTQKKGHHFSARLAYTTTTSRTCLLLCCHSPKMVTIFLHTLLILLLVYMMVLQTPCNCTTSTRYVWSCQLLLLYEPFGSWNEVLLPPIFATTIKDPNRNLWKGSILDREVAFSGNPQDPSVNFEAAAMTLHDADLACYCYSFLNNITRKGSCHRFELVTMDTPKLGQ